MDDLLRSLEETGLLSVFMIVASVAFLFAVINRITTWSQKKDGLWHPYGDKMRRYVRGQWYYRPLTQAEIEEEIDRQDRNVW